MTTLVIGAGLIGSQVARILVERGEKPVLMDVAAQASAIGQIVDVSKVTLRPATSCGRCRSSMRCGPTASPGSPTPPPIRCSPSARSVTRMPPSTSTSWAP